MDIEALRQRTAPRVQAIVCREGRILMARHQEEDVCIWCLPGGALEDGETPEEGALRELREEAGVEGRVVRQVGCSLDARGATSAYTYLVDIGDQKPTLGHDPEVETDVPILVGVEWLALHEIPERDRAFLWQSGLMSVPGFVDEVTTWGDQMSYPG